MKMGLKQKLTLMILPAVLGLIAFSCSQIYSDWNTLNEMKSFQKTAQLGVTSSNLVHELQKERGMSAGLVGSKGKKFADKIDSQRALVDKAYDAFEAKLKSVDTASFSAELRASLNTSSEMMAQIEGMRKAVSVLKTSVHDVVAYYSKMNGSFLAGLGELSTTTKNAKLALDVQAFTSFLQSKERAGIERAVLSAAFGADQIKAKVFLKYLTLKTEQETYLKVFNAVANEHFRNIVRKTVSGDVLKQAAAYRSIIESKTSGFDVDPTVWFSVQTGKINLLKKAEDKLAKELMHDAEEMASAASASLMLILAITFLLLIASVMITRKVLGGILISVHAAVDVSNAIAKGKLNNKIDVSQSDEVGVLMQTLERMQTTFLENRKRDDEAKIRDDEAKEQAADYEGQLDAIGKVMATIEFELDGTIRTANDNFLQALGYSLGEIKGKHHNLFVESKYKSSAAYAQFWQKLNNGEPIAEQFLRIGKGGKQVWIQASYNPIRDTAGHVYKVVKFATDITEQTLAAQQLQSMMSDASATLQAMSEGDLTVTVNGNYQGDLASLQEAINATVKNLNDSFGDIKVQAEDVGGVSSELEVANNTLNKRTQEQAAALEQVAASIEEITGTVQQTADNSRQANQLAADASEQAKQGGDVAEKAVDAMSHISASSRKISDIIGVIDEIAFQTNLLALNAAVEAARAGEQGRGFAVVASEVRTLSQRSAEAAKEIKTLINSSVESVNAGSRLVDESGKALHDIVDAVAKVNDIISEIAAASIEQTTGIDQINTAIAQLDSGTQQNAALVEESAAASERLNGQANQLRKQVGLFHLGE